MKLPISPRISRSLLVLFFLLGIASSATAGKLKIGTVNMMYLLSEFHEKKAAVREEVAEMKEIEQADQDRLEAIKAVNDELKKMENQVNDPSLAEAKRKQIRDVALERKGTLDALMNEREGFLQKRKQALNQKMLGLADDMRKKVSAAVEAHAATVDVDLVFDESGLSTTQVPFMLYGRNTVDLTKDVLKKLNKDVLPLAPDKTKSDPPE